VLAKKGRGKSLRESDHLMVKNKMGSNPFNCFVHGSNTSHMIVDTIDEHFVALFQYIESNEVTNEKSTTVHTGTRDGFGDQRKILFSLL